MNSQTGPFIGIILARCFISDFNNPSFQNFSDFFAEHRSGVDINYVLS